MQFSICTISISTEKFQVIIIIIIIVNNNINVLHTNNLTDYERGQPPMQTLSIYKSFIFISQNEKKPNVFGIQLADENEYSLMAENQSLAVDWMRMLQENARLYLFIHFIPVDSHIKLKILPNNIYQQNRQ